MKLVDQYMVIFYNFSPTSNYLHPLQVENCGSNSRLVVDGDNHGKFRLQRVNSPYLLCQRRIFFYNGCTSCEYQILFEYFILYIYFHYLTAECGIVAQILEPLAEHNISDYYISTYYSDHTLVRRNKSNMQFFM